MNTHIAALDKIRRLLRLGTSSNEHEAQSALAKAAEIARRHSIDLGAVKADEDRARIGERIFESAEILGVVGKAAIQLCMALFHVRCITQGFRCTYIGFPHNVEASMFAHGFIVEQCGRDLKAFKRDRAKRYRKRVAQGAAHQYCIGWVYGVQRRYEKEITSADPQAVIEDSKTAIILRDQERELSDYMDSQHAEVPTAKKPRYRKDNMALVAGVRDGLKVSINRPLGGQATLCLL